MFFCEWRGEEVKATCVSNGPQVARVRKMPFTRRPFSGLTLTSALCYTPGSVAIAEPHTMSVNYVAYYQVSTNR